MAQTLVRRMVWSSLRPLQEALKQDERRLTEEEIQDLLDACELCPKLIETLREGNKKLLKHGVERRKLSFLLKESMDAIGEVLRICARIRTIAGTELPPERRTDGLARLADAQRRTEDVGKDFEATLRWLENPPPRVDVASLSAGGASPPAEGYANIEDVLAQLRAGEDV